MLLAYWKVVGESTLRSIRSWAEERAEGAWILGVFGGRSWFWDERQAFDEVLVLMLGV